MQPPAIEIVDLALSQAIERYTEMESYAVYTAISAEWPEQIAVLLEEIFFKTTCINNPDLPRFIPIKRKNGLSSYLTPVCICGNNK